MPDLKSAMPSRFLVELNWDVSLSEAMRGVLEKETCSMGQ